MITGGGCGAADGEGGSIGAGVGDRGWPAGACELGPVATGRLAALVDADRDLILQSYLDELEALDHASVRDEGATARVLVVAGRLLDEVCAGLRADRVVAAPDQDAACDEAGQACAGSGVQPRDVLQAVSAFFRTVLERVGHLVQERPDASALLSRVAIELERAIMARLSTSGVIHADNLLDQLHEVQSAERHRIADALRERIGQCITVTHQQLELFSRCLDLDLDEAAQKVRAAQHAVIESMLDLSAFTSALYTVNPLRSLGAALEPDLGEPTRAPDPAEPPAAVLDAEVTVPEPTGFARPQDAAGSGRLAGGAGAVLDKISVVLVDEHVLVREGIREILAAEGDIVVVAVGATSEEALAVVAEHRPDVVLMEVEVPGRHVAETVAGIRESSPHSRILVLSRYDPPATLRRLIAAGVNGYLLKSVEPQELVLAIRTVYRKPDRTVLSVSRESLARLQGPEEQVLSARELAILRLVAQALSNSQIATRMQLSEASVKRHLHSVFVKLEAVSRIDAVNKAIAASLITGEAYEDIRATPH